jgi:site-specific DNA recombinase
VLVGIITKLTVTERRNRFSRTLQKAHNSDPPILTRYSRKTNRLVEALRQIEQVKHSRDRLLNLRIVEEIAADTYAAKDTELRDRLACLELQLQAQGRGRDEHGDLALKVFELSQSLKDKWLTAESQEKRQLLEIICLNLTLKEEKLDFSMRKPFDVLAKGLVSPDNRGDRI